jgi:hypothetical protein
MTRKYEMSVVKLDYGRGFKTYVSIQSRDSNIVLWLNSIDEARELQKEMELAIRLIGDACGDFDAEVSDAFTQNENLAKEMEALERVTEKFSGEGFAGEEKI